MATIWILTLGSEEVAGHESQNSTFKHRGVRDPELTDRSAALPRRPGEWRALEGQATQTRTLKNNEEKNHMANRLARRIRPVIYYIFIQSTASTEFLSSKVHGEPLVYLQRRKDLSKVTHGQLVGQSRLDIGPANANSNVKNIRQLCRADGVSSDRNLPSLALASPLSNAPPCSSHSRHHALSQAQDIHLPTCHSLILISNHPSTNHSKEAMSANLSPSSQRSTKCSCFWASAPPITT